MTFTQMLRVAAIATFAGAGCGHAVAARTNVAVAANFTEAAKQIATLFQQQTGHEAVLSFGSSGQFYNQIAQGAPFEVFLSADDARPKQLLDEGLGVAGSGFTYAIGKLVLWSRNPTLATGEDILKVGAFSKLAIANPVAAPYGVAAIETLRALKVYDALQAKIVQGNSIAQAYQFVDTGNAELGFVALSQLAAAGGSRWIVPASLYTAIRQDAVLLKQGAPNAAATAFIAFLKGPDARAIIEQFGYATGEGR